MTSLCKVLRCISSYFNRNNRTDTLSLYRWWWWWCQSTDSMIGAGLVGGGVVAVAAILAVAGVLLAKQH
jgi:hypothetical protein